MDADEVSYVDANEDNWSQNDMWMVISKFFENRGLVKQQLKSYNSFINNCVDSVLDDKGHITLQSDQLLANKIKMDFNSNDDDEDQGKTIHISFGTSTVLRPTTPEGKQLTPMISRLRSLSYSLILRSDIRVVVMDSNKNMKQLDVDGVEIAKVPVMIRSEYCHLSNHRDDRAINDNLNECDYDPGGYFIVNGSEKVIIGQEHMVINKPICYAQKSMVKYDLATEIRSQPKVFGRLSQPFNLFLLAPTAKQPERPIHAKLSKTEKTIPLFILFRALKFKGDKEILDLICYDPEDSEFIDVLRPSIEESSSFLDDRACLDFVGKRCSIAAEEKSQRLRKAQRLLNEYLLPHLGEKESDTTSKAFFIGYMAHNLINVVLGRRDQDDRDHYSNKRLDLAGPLIGQLFALLFEKMIKSLTQHLEKRLKDGNIDQMAKSAADLTRQGVLNFKSITSGLEYSIGTGNWSVQRQAGSKAGVSQMLNRLTFLSTLSNLRRTNTPIGRDGKLTGPRHLHNTHWGYICPVETPEGQSCGLIKNLALMSIVTVNRELEAGDAITRILEDTGTIPIQQITPDQIKDSTKIFLNGAWYGIHTDAYDLMETLLSERRSLKIPSDVSFVHHIRDQEIFIWTDGGRITRPVLIVNDMHLTLKKSVLYDENTNWKVLRYKGMVEYLDIDEEETKLIALSPADLEENRNSPTGVKTYTHCEIHPSLIFGVCGTIIPFPDHNQSPRNTYQCAMGKQAIGLYTTNYMIRMDSSSHVLWYPQKPLVATRNMRYLNFNKLPAGINVTVAICCYTGYNQEDSLMLNASAIDRGLFRSYFFRTYKETAEGDGTEGASEVFTFPDPQTVKGIKLHDSSKIDADGLAIPGAVVSAQDVIIGKISPDSPTELDHRQYKDTSCVVRPMETGVVDLVLRTITKKNLQLARVRTRQMRRPEIGDKFCSRHGQKGVCGMTYRQEDMPFTRDGMVPDIIMNPHALPSRMTIGHLIECLLGKCTAIDPQNADEGDATPFCGVTVDAIAKRLQDAGFEKYGNETLYNGRSGKRLKAKIYFGPTYYQRLKHMVGDKAHARALGRKSLILRQPVDGRARNGGLRFGEMERDCLIAHGVSAMMRDRLLENSDRYFVPVCKTCGLIAIEKTDGTMECPACQDEGRLAKVEMPYAFKLVIQELMSMCIAPRLNLIED
ncbi:DNA-directed RNA polymerase, beta subunit family protein [Trichomonas vaginalis G3]|uniref:DNA-directed RNA polymerase subunit beta n=1 Tax=Trichomonas vaginalis (strain ATCC PRA-98 / G3) TaxID=412133 RepID=A2E7H8_TRIV3|nr:beta and beta-prime subunits of DNA dependent RNA-polymerase family [Trichomonas vaginalis G3]EAY11371.1 DNA-directed RNA polymerase, beta subunit family protein [Trichomonas vaginalis G3]KAI5530536.1 beta and beta-prime subunits of DNA dependent RNA-polymerase family [Trichomonas vaginalis G3]|eukprot:XP_001323594.1 DNA-directed RNA polymerase, beta subunit family protein [Trichomonas vaginalis G3]